ncbi:MAG: M48 family metallopeptidase [Brevinematales bacterium]
MIKNPKIKMFFRQMLGYFYIISVFLFFILIFLALFLIFKTYELSNRSIIKLLIFSGAGLFVIFRSFFKSLFDFYFKRKEEPYGFILDRAEYKDLYDLIDEISLKIKAPKIHVIKLDFSMNSQVIELPNFLFFGYKRFLIIGVPLLLITSLEEFKSIIAHECYHLSKSDSKVAMKILRMKTIFNHLIEDIGKTRGGSVLFLGLFFDFVVKMNDFFYNFSKENELKADKVSLKVSDKNSCSNALIKTSYYGMLLRSFFDSLWENSKMGSSPINNMLNEMEKFFKEKANDIEFSRYIEDLLNEVSLPNTTHPTLKERIENLDSEAVTTIFYYESTLRKLFSEDKVGILFDKMNEFWKNSVSEDWKNRFDYFNQRNSRLVSLNSRLDKLSLEELIERALLLSELSGENEGLFALKEIEKLYPEDKVVKFHIGKILVRKNDKEGLKYLEDIIKTDFDFAPYAAYELFCYYYFYEKDINKSAEYYNIGVSIIETNEEIKKERETFLFTDKYYPLLFDYEITNEIISKLKKYKKVEKAYMLMKRSSEELFPVYILAIKYKPFWKSTDDKIVKECILPYRHWVIQLNKSKGFEYLFSEFVGGRIL